MAILDATLFGVLVLFNCWNWFLAFKGVTTIEFWLGEDNKYLKGFETVSDNFYQIFGTQKILRIFSPSLRNGPFTGLEWSFLIRDHGFDCEGKKMNDIESITAATGRTMGELHGKPAEETKNSLEIEDN